MAMQVIPKGLIHKNNINNWDVAGILTMTDLLSIFRPYELSL